MRTYRKHLRPRHEANEMLNLEESLAQERRRKFRETVDAYYEGKFCEEYEAAERC